MAETRFIQYGDKRIPLEEGMTLEQAKQLMSRHFPELADPQIKTEKKGEVTTYVFSKKAGRKGGPHARKAHRSALRRLKKLEPRPALPDERAEAILSGRPEAMSQTLAQRLRAEAELTQEANRALRSLRPRRKIKGSVL